MRTNLDTCCPNSLIDISLSECHCSFETLTVNPKIVVKAVEEAANYYCDLLRPIYKNRKLLHVAEIDVGMVGRARMLDTLGAAPPLLIAGNQGTSTTEIPSDLNLITLGISAGSNMVETTRNLERLLSDLPIEVREQIRQWDPKCESNWVCTGMLGELSTVAGRSKYGKRLPKWTAIEDKTTIDSFWDSIGVQRAPSKVVSVSDNDIHEVAADLDEGRGTVWAADNRRGVHGGAIGIRWAKSNDEIISVVEELRDFGDRVRIAPFLEGVPMSIHGVVFPTSVAVFRPVELITLRYRDKSKFLWGGCSTSYDPSDQDRTEMREVARRAGNALRQNVNFRGPFSIDGVITEHGFMPTELNPRMSGGFGPLTKGLPDLPFAPLCWAAMEDEDLDFRPELLEQTILEHADSTRILRGHVVTSKQFNETNQLELVRDGQEFREACPNEDSDATLTCGPSPTGGIIFLHLDETTPTGTMVAPEMVRAIRFCDRSLGTNFGPLDCAVEAKV